MVIIELILGVAAIVLEFCLNILIFSWNAWRFCLSPAFRAQIQEELREESKIPVMLIYLYGVVSIALSLLVIAFLAYVVFWFFKPEPEPSVTQEAYESIGKFIEIFQDTRDE